MNDIVTKYIVLILGFTNLSIHAQEYFSVEFDTDFGSTNFVAELLEINGNIIVFSKNLCDETGNTCSSFRVFSDAGLELEQNILTDFSAGQNIPLTLNNDEIIISGHDLDFPGTNLYHRVYDLDLNELKTFSNTPIENHYQLNKGVIHLDGNTYITSDIQDIGYPVRILGLITLWNKSDQTYDPIYIADHYTGKNEIFDISTSSDSELIFLIRGKNSGQGEDYFNIVRIDTLGNQISSFEYSSVPATGAESNLLVNQDGDYFIVTKGPSFSLSIQIICFSAEDFSEKWNYEFPLDFTGGKLERYSIRDIALCKNGDIIGCGSVCDNNDQGEVFESGLIFRLTKNGELLWLKKYLKEDGISIEDDYRESVLTKAYELENGDIVFAGHYFTKNEMGNYLGSNLWLLKTNENGCISENDCEENILTNTFDYDDRNKELKFFPNPVDELLYFDNLNFDGVGVIKIYDISQKMVLEETVNSSSGAINLQNLLAGMYYLELTSPKGYVQSTVVIKI